MPEGPSVGGDASCKGGYQGIKVSQSLPAGLRTHQNISIIATGLTLLQHRSAHRTHRQYLIRARAASKRR